MNVSYQADADLNQAIVTGVLRREPTIDFQTCYRRTGNDLGDIQRRGMERSDCKAAFVR